MLRAMGLLGASASLAGCVATPAPAPVVAAVQPAYLTAIAAPSTGRALQPQGGVPTFGRAVTVSTAPGGPALGQDGGIAAKDAAAAACAATGGTFNPRALGRFAGNVWVFDGACA